MRDLVGQTIENRYELRRVISHSARATVFEARHRFTEQPLAIKLLSAASAKDSHERQAVMSEAKLLGEVRHPCIVQAVDAGVTKLTDGSDPTPFLVMELLDGRDVHGLLATRGKLDVAEVVGVGLAICRALAMLQRWGALHRDITPSNIIVPPTRPWERDWEAGISDAKLLGFGGMAYALIGEGPRDAGLPDIAYRAPELFEGTEPTMQSDIYALGAVLYECLTDGLPLGRTIASPHEERDEVPIHISKAIMTALAKDPAERHVGPKAFADALWEARTSIQVEPKPDLQRRQTVRAPYLTPLRLVRDGMGHLAGRCEDISKGGMLVLTSTALPQDEKLDVQFALPGTAGLVTEQAVVRWSRTGRQGACVLGLQFVAARPEVEQAIGRYVRVFGDSPRG